MFAHFRRVESHLQIRLQVSVVESRRVAGKVCVEHIASLGSVGEPATNAERVAFWGNLHRRIDDRAKIIGAIHARIPMVTIDEIRALQRENAESDEKFWSVFQGMNADFATGQKVIAGIASRKAAESESLAKDAGAKASVAKERLARLAKGEDIKGGLGKPMTGEECDRILKREGLTDDDIRFMRQFRLTEAEFDSFVRLSCELHQRHEKRDRWKVLRKIKAMRK
jgi:hypothetical protein